MTRIDINCNEDCSEHMLSHVSTGKLFKPKRDIVAWNSRSTDPSTESVYVAKGDILLLTHKEMTLPNNKYEEYCCSWTFGFLHKTFGQIYFYWNMNLYFETDLNTFLESIET